MHTLRFRLSGAIAPVQRLLALLNGLDDVDRLEEVDDQMDHMREDSSSNGLPDDTTADFHDIELHALTSAAAETARDRIEIAARDLGIAVEFVHRF